ncbi:MAG: hypothetical protein MZV70_15790 [Desulfobacterales bacterium]|nr:hypothetical protein [Desulfobacterales bacterium]
MGLRAVVRGGQRRSRCMSRQRAYARICSARGHTCGGSRGGVQGEPTSGMRRSQRSILPNPMAPLGVSPAGWLAQSDEGRPAEVA